MIIAQSIEQKVIDAIQPLHLEVTNESHMHNVLPGSESHFKLIVVSETFEGLRLVGRHQLINAALKDELTGPCSCTIDGNSYACRMDSTRRSNDDVTFVPWGL